MPSKCKPNVFYYSRNNSAEQKAPEQAPRIARELAAAFFHSFANNLSSDKTLTFINKTRIPNERELYGLFIQSLLESELKNDLGYIATEFQVGRADEAKGRVDVFFNYRNTSFLIELKVARIGLPSNKANHENMADGEEEFDSNKRIFATWNDGVVSQLQDLNVESLKSCLHNKIVKMPMVVYLYVDWSKKGLRDNWLDDAQICHDHIINNLAENPPDFEYYTILEQPIRTRKRSSSLGEEEFNMSLYGFSLVASDLDS